MVMVQARKNPERRRKPPGRPPVPKGTAPTPKTKALYPRVPKGWTVEEPPAAIRDFVEWYAWSRAVGDTYSAYARDTGLTLTTVFRWMRDPRVVELLETELRKTNAGPHKVQQVLDRLHVDAVAGNVSAARLYLETVDRLSPRKVEITVRDARDLSNDELKRELRTAYKRLASQASGDQASDDEIVDAELVDVDVEDGGDVEHVEPPIGQASGLTDEEGALALPPSNTTA